MNLKLWNTCNDLDTVVANQKATQDIFSYILEGLDRIARETERNGQEAYTAFMSQYKNFSEMLFMLLGVMQSQVEEAKSLIDRVFFLVKEENQ